jgi:hypothetical protein
MTIAARPDLLAHEKSLQAPQILAKELREWIGPRLVAYCTGVSETRAVHQWADDGRTPRPEAAKRLQLLYYVVAMLMTRASPPVAQAWLQGMNPRLGDRAPARLIREGEPSDVAPDVLDAARSFVAGS